MRETNMNNKTLIRRVGQMEAIQKKLNALSEAFLQDIKEFVCQNVFEMEQFDDLELLVFYQPSDGFSICYEASGEDGAPRNILLDDAFLNEVEAENLAAFKDLLLTRSA